MVQVPSITIEESAEEGASTSGAQRVYEGNLPPRQDLSDHNHIHPPNALNGGLLPKRKSAEVLDPADFIKLANKRGSNGSFTEEAKTFTKRASQMIIEVPVAGLRKIKKTQGANSMDREIQHFVGITTLHGPLRIYRGKNYSRVFWGIMMMISLILLIYQTVTLFQMYITRPTTSEVNFLISEDGMDFPMVTICNFNPIRKNYIKQMINQSGDFSEALLDYLIQYNYEVHNLYSNGNPQLLEQGQKEYERYTINHANFTVTEFFSNGGFTCRELMKVCTFAGVEFDCCANTKPIFTDLGKCFLINTTSLPDSSMHRQTAAGVNSGLQLIMDSHLEEQFDGNGFEPQPIFTNALENGFRYYIHPSNTIPHVVSEGISVSPGGTVYSALTVSNYDLLDKNGWGNCTTAWPKGFSTTLPYSSANCASLCKAKYFEENCGCSPFVYNVDNAFKTCMPWETWECLNKSSSTAIEGRKTFKLPSCTECGIECNSWNYAAFNSYGQGFSNGAVKWVQQKNNSDTGAHIRSNYVSVNVFYRDMTYMKYIQQKGTSLTEILSDIGGNMGMWLGMSILSAFEIMIFCSKMIWMFFSRKRRQYMFEKKQSEENKEKEIENTMSQLQAINKMDEHLDEETASTLEKLRRRIEQTLHHKSSKVHKMSITPIAPSFAMTERERKKSSKVIVHPNLNPHEDHEEHDQKEAYSEQQRKNFMENFYNNALYGDGRANTISEVIQEEDEGEHGEGRDHELQRQDNSVIQLKIDLAPIEEAMSSVEMPRRRTISVVPATCEYVNREERSRSRTRSTVDRKPSFYIHLDDDVFQ